MSSSVPTTAAQTRLDKLLKLLQEGKTATIRDAAANQVADIALSQSSVLEAVIKKVHALCYAKQWDSRVAAGRCFYRLASSMPHSTPGDIAARARLDLNEIAATIAKDTSQLEDFKLESVLQNGRPLLQSGGQEYDILEDSSSAGERLQKQRLALQKRLGMGDSMGQIMGTEDLVGDQDLLDEPTDKKARIKQKASSEKRTADTLLSDMTGLSSREQNQLKRKLKQAGKEVPQKPKRAKTGQEDTENLKVVQSISVLEEAPDLVSGRWPFQSVADRLVLDCLDPTWETRHGAALALREILSCQAFSAAVHGPIEEEPTGWAAKGGTGKQRLRECSKVDALNAAVANRTWLETCAVHLLCCLALDRFGDYISDQVTAPVRETAAQALGAVSRPFSPAQVLCTLNHLRLLTENAEWSVRHGGFLGLKYLLAAQLNPSPETLSVSQAMALTGLNDQEDDIRAVAAEALLPVAAEVATRDPAASNQLKSRLWDILLVLEDLDLSTGSVMQLLGVLCSCSKTEERQPVVRELVPRLYPFFRHTLTSVRLASVLCLHALLDHDSASLEWLSPEVLRPALCLSFQNLVLDIDQALLEKSKELWKLLLVKAPKSSLAAACHPTVIQNFFSLAATAEGCYIDQSKILSVPAPTCSGLPLRSVEAYRIEGSAHGNQIRFDVAEALASLAAAWPEEIEAWTQSQAASGNMLAALTAMMWLKLPSRSKVPPGIMETLMRALSRPKADRKAQGQLRVYAELAKQYSQTQSVMQNLLKKAEIQWLQCASHSVPLDDLLRGAQPQHYAAMLTADNLKEVLGRLELGCNEELLEASSIAHSMTDTLAKEENLLHNSVLSVTAAAVIEAGKLPAKLNLVIQPVMASLRRAADPLLRSCAAVALAKLVQCCSGRTPSPVSKIIGNVAGLVCGDERETPKASSPDPEEEEEPTQRPGSKKANGTESQDLLAEAVAESAQIAREGGEEALRSVVHHFAEKVLSEVPKVRELIDSGLATNSSAPAETQAVLDSLQCLRVAGPAMDQSLDATLIQWICQSEKCLSHGRSIVRTLAAKSVAALTNSRPEVFMNEVLRIILPALSSTDASYRKSGAVAVVSQLVAQLQDRLLPYIFLLIVPTMKCMSDQRPTLRSAATSSFAAMVALLPLAQGLKPPDTLDSIHRQIWLRDSQFLEQLLDNKQTKPFNPPIRNPGELRPYQQDGINWLAFLRDCGLHGVLADDMGLGKTLQATAMLAGAHSASRSTEGLPSRSLVICPQVLVGHWAFEIQKYVEADLLRTLAYEGTPLQRQALRSSFEKADVIIMSYETLRVDIESLHQARWLYCILDEGHLIRNPRSKVTQAVKRIQAQHRLILSGTPIQNNIQELWALFDFLMPGFLGSESNFNQRFGKAFKTGRSSKTGSNEAQAGLLAMEGLHKQVTPFILRRTKDSVLKDLPPKILQDVYCSLSPLQATLYEGVSGGKASQELEATVASMNQPQDAAAATPHIFQALQYLRKLCSHPLMVLDSSKSQQAAVALSATHTTSWGAAEAALHSNLEHAPKLLALQQLLQQCGIGMQENESPVEDSLTEGAFLATSHRVLVFAQFKRLLDIVEEDVIKPMGTSYLRLDGGVEPSQRFGIVQQFNQDPSIAVMLLTTSVGGLGLNLTAADTVIFLEHDWNPMKDLQAMDRAHRLGQKNTVHVYRLLMRDSLEERIMSLQRFKVDVANAVINQDNVSLKDMNTGGLLDILHRPSQTASAISSQRLGGASDLGAKGNPSNLKAMLDGLEEMWDNSQYDEEFSVEGFMKKLA